jgi:hypothetical protein
MKSFKILLNQTFLSILIFMLILNVTTYAGEKSGALNINPQFSFFKDKYSDNSFIPINPGGEILYEFGLNNRLSLSSGFNYSFSIWKYGYDFYFKRLAHEMYLPLIIKFELNQKFFTESGIYSGWLIKGKELYEDEYNHIDLRDITKNTNYYSSPKFTADLYFGAGINYIVNDKPTIRFIPFIKYKIKDNWMEEVRERISAGLKINFPIRI